MGAGFLDTEHEDGDFNQYWYSRRTIDTLVQEVQASSSGGNVAFLATPSIFFSLPEGSSVQRSSYLFDLDTRWSAHPNYVCYDFKRPQHVPEHLLGSFSMVIIDPPFITSDVWRLFAATAQLLLKPGGRVICTTVAENGPLMNELFGASSCVFKPLVPNLVYQYTTFTNYQPSEALCAPNPEVPEDD